MKDIQPTEHFHGSDLEKIEKIYGIQKEDIVSFSANVNPLGLSEKLKRELSNHLDVLTAYPDREYTQLRNTIAKYCNTNPDYICPGNGSTELISLFIKTVGPMKALILAPTYSEYEHELYLSGALSDYFTLKEEEDFKLNLPKLLQQLESQDYQMLILCNPDNPTSGAITSLEMNRILNKCAEKNIFVLVDETYVEFAINMEEITSIPLVEEYENLAVLRGVSKFFAAPGLRLGYAITSNRSLLEKVTSSQNAWSINSLAEAAGKLMFTDEAFIKETKQLIFSQREYMSKQLNSIPGLKTYPASGNFILIKILSKNVSAHMIFEACIREGMMVRDCSTFVSLDDTYFRVCIMSPADNQRLINCIKKVMA